MKKVKLISLFISIFLIIGLAVSIILIKDKIPNNKFCFLDIGTYAVPPIFIEVNSSNICGQSFVSNFDNLFMMSIFIPRQNLDSNKELLFHLKNKKDDNKDLVTLKWKYNQIHFKENNFYLVPPDRESTDRGFHFHFQFSPIKDSKNKQFYFYFESPDAKPAEGIKLGLWDNRNYYEALTKGNLFINHQPVKGFLAFRTYNTWDRNPSILRGEIKTRLFKDKPFIIFYSTLLFIILSDIVLISVKNR